MRRKIIITGVFLAIFALSIYLFSGYYRNVQIRNFVIPGIKKPNIFFILIDTLRADHLTCYGYDRPTSPFMDGLAKRGILFENAYTVAPWTNPTIATLFTGLYPQAVFPAAAHKIAIQQSLPLEVNTLAELLKENGYRTVAVVDHPGINKKLQYDQGFELFKPLFLMSSNFEGTEPDIILKEVVALFPESETESTFFYLHLIQPHRPYRPRPPYDKLFGPGFDRFEIRQKNGLINMYDGEVRETDEVIGKILEHPKISALLKRTYVLISSDHGEGFGEHGRLDHGNSLFNELLKIPLLIIPPKSETIRSIRVPQPVSNIDLYPTIAELAGVNSPESIQGRSLLRYLLRPDPDDQRELLFSESPHSGNIEAAACMKDSRKYIYEPREPSPFLRLFDLRADPRERKNLARGKIDPSFHKALLLHLSENKKRRSGLSQKKDEPDSDTLERLRALGYTTD